MGILSNYFETIKFRLSHRKQILLPIGMVISVLLASAAIAYQGTPNQIRLLLLLLPGFLAVNLFIQAPGLGLILTLLGGFFIKISGPSGLNVTMVGIAFLFGLWLAKMIIVDRQIRLTQIKTSVPVLFFIIISILSFGIGLLPFMPFANQAPLDAQLGGFAIFILSSAAFLLSAYLIDMRWLERLTWVFIAVGAVYITGRMLIVVGISIEFLFDRGATASSMFFTWLVAQTFSQAWFNKRIHIAFRGILFFLIIIIFIVAYGFASEWKSGWVPPLVAIGAILGFRYWRLAILLVPIIVIVAWIAVIQIISSDTYSWGTRVDAWMIVIEIAKISPIFGLGFSNYYWYSRYFPIRGWYVPFNSHNQYIDIIAQTGIVGLACFLWIFWEVGRLGWNLRNRVPEGFPRAYVYGVLGGIVGTLVASSLADWVLPFTYNIGFAGFRSSVLPWIFMGGLVCIEQLVRKQADSQKA